MSILSCTFNVFSRNFPPARLFGTLEYMSFKLFAKNRQQILRAREALPFYQIFRPSYTVFRSSVCWVNPVRTDLRIIQVFIVVVFHNTSKAVKKSQKFFSVKTKWWCSVYIFVRRNQRFDKIGMSVFIYLLLMYFKFFSHLKWLSKIFNVNTYISTYLLKKYLQSCQMLFRYYLLKKILYSLLT